MKFCVLASGSKGNMTYIEAGSSKILIDAGITLKGASSRCLDIDFSSITDILITHDHIDHTRNIETILRKTNANLYLARETFDELKKKGFQFTGFKVMFIEGEGKYKIGDVEVLTLELSHDAKAIFGFIIIHDGKQLGYITDTGIFPNKYKSLISEMDAIIIESNHNVEMLINSKREQFLIKRILSPKGHLSNQACFEVLYKTLTVKQKYVILAHVSEDCNCDECLYEEVINKLENTYKGEILIARQNEALKMIEL